MRDELAGLSEEARNLALDRFRILQPHLEQTRLLQSVALAASLSIGSSDWRLWRGKPVDRGGRRVASDELKRAIEGLALQKPLLPIAALYRQVRTIAQQRGETAPSYSVVYDIVHRLPADLVTLAHEGSKAYSDAFELVHRREAERRPTTRLWTLC